PRRVSPHSPQLPPFLFNAAAPSQIYTLSLHDALPIYQWATEVDAPSAGASLKAWTSRHKCLRECRNLDDVVDAARDHRPDETYLALTREHQNGDTLATLVVLRALYNWTRATARRCQHRFDTLEDAEAATVIAIIEAATALPRDRQVRIVSYLTTRALNAVAGRS